LTKDDSLVAAFGEGVSSASPGVMKDAANSEMRTAKSFIEMMP
jgi:hypothetical protein